MSCTTILGGNVGMFPLNLGISFLREWMGILGYNELSSVSPDSLHGCCKSGNVLLLVKLLHQHKLREAQNKQTRFVDQILSQKLPFTPLFFACLENNEKIIDLLLFRNQATLNFYHTTASQAVSGFVEIAEGVSSLSSDLYPHCAVHESIAVPSVWHIVCATGNVALLKKFLRKVCTQQKSISVEEDERKDEKRPRSSPSVAVMQFDPLSPFASSTVDSSNSTFLHPITLACVYGHGKVVKCLFNFYQDFTAVHLAGVGCYMGLNVLMLACFSRNLQLLAYLVQHEATKHLIHVPAAVFRNKTTTNVLWQRFKVILNASEQGLGKGNGGAKVNEQGIVDKVFQYEFSPLILCVCLQWFDAVEFLLQVVTERQLEKQHEKGVSDLIGYSCLHTANPTALHWAASLGNCDILDILSHYHFKRILARHFSATVQSNHILTAGFQNAREVSSRMKDGDKGEVEKVKRAREKRGHPLFSNNTCLHSAVRCNQLTTALRLLHLCPQWVNVADYCSNLPLHYACLHKNMHLFNALLHKTTNSTHIMGENGYTALHFLCLPRPPSRDSSSDAFVSDDVIVLMFRSLVSLGADVCKRDSHDGCTALHLAIEFLCPSLFLSLLNTCCNPHDKYTRSSTKQPHIVNIQDFQGRTLLHYAAEMNNMELSEKLLELDASVESEDHSGKRPVHLATEASFACFLIEHGAQLNAQDSNGMSPLHLAVIQGNVDMVALLLSYPDVNYQLKTHAGMNVLHLACELAPSSGDRALLVLKQLISNITNCSQLDVCIQSEDSTEEAKSKQSESEQQPKKKDGVLLSKSAINCAIRPDSDALGVQMLKVLFAHGLYKAQGDMLLALRCAIKHELICTCTFLLQAFKSQISEEMIKTLLFFAISLAKSHIFQFLLCHVNETSAYNGGGDSQHVLMDIEHVQNPFSSSSSNHYASSRSSRTSFSALRTNNHVPQSSGVISNLLLYPIEWCIVTAAFKHSTRRRRYFSKALFIMDEVDGNIAELLKIFNIIVNHCAKQRRPEGCFNSTSTSSAAAAIHKFDFLTNKSIMSSVLNSACDNQTIFHMLTQWLSFNEMDPCLVLSNLQPPNNSRETTTDNSMTSELPTSPRSSFAKLPKSILFILTVHMACNTCVSFWRSHRGSGSIWRTLLDCFHPNEPKVSSMLEVVLITALGLGGPSCHSRAADSLSELIDTDDADILRGAAADFQKVRLSEMCATVVRKCYFSVNEILRLQFHMEEKSESEQERVPSFLIASVAGGLLSLPRSTKQSLQLCADYIQLLSKCCALSPTSN